MKIARTRTAFISVSTYCQVSLELNHLSLTLLFSSQLKVFGSLDWSLQREMGQSIDIIRIELYLVLPLAFSTLQLEDQLLGSLALLPQDGFGLTSESLLFTIISSPSLGLLGLSRFLVLGHLELLVSL